MENFATPYPVFFFDGKYDHGKGHVGVHSALTFDRFQTQMSQKTGIPANRLSTVFVYKKTFRDVTKQEKLPINESTNFSIILNQHNPNKEEDCYFLVSIKMSRKERKVSRKCTADVENNACLSPISPMNWLSESGSSEGSGNDSPANRILSDGNIKFNLHRHPGTLQSRYATVKSDLDDVVIEPKIENSSSVAESKNEGADLFAAVHSHSANLNVQQENQRKCDIQAIQEIPFGAYKVFPKVAVSQRLMFSQFNDQMLHSELFNQQRYGKNISQALNLRPNISLIRNGVVSAGYAAPFNKASRFFHPRVPLLSAAAPLSFTARDISLQRMQSHLLQAQQRKPQVCILSYDLPRYNAGFCNWVPIVTSQGDHQQSLCEVCYDFKRRNIYPTPFHCCVQDRVTLGFRGPSPTGPIERPRKSCVQM